MEVSWRNTKQAKNIASHGCFNTQFVNNNFKAIDLKKLLTAVQELDANSWNFIKLIETWGLLKVVYVHISDSSQMTIFRH